MLNLLSLCVHLCMCVCVCILVCYVYLCVTLYSPRDHSLPESSVHGILQARILEWVAMSSSRKWIFLTQGSNWPLLCLLHWQVGSLPLAPPRKPPQHLMISYNTPPPSLRYRTPSLLVPPQGWYLPAARILPSSTEAFGIWIPVFLINLKHEATDMAVIRSHAVCLKPMT